MKKKYNYKYIVGFLLGLFIVLGSAYASIRYSSSIVLYDKNATNLISTDVQNAIDELAGIYQLPSTCPEGKICFHKLPSFITDNAVMDNVASTYVTSSTGIDFSQISSASNGQGIYIRAGTENDIYPIYYYRGVVTNNNVLFGNFCWKIVRTTDTGGVKIIYSGTPTSGSCVNTTGTDAQIGISAFNSNYTSLADVGYMHGTRYVFSERSSSSLATPYKYGNRFSYSGETYTLVDTITSTGSWERDMTTLNNNHYTCFNDTGVCNSLYYIYYASIVNVYYITLTGGKSIETAIDEMLSNTISSTIKSFIDSWYETNLANNEFNLEDTVWCNDREIYQLGGWNPDGGTIVNFHKLYFKPYERSNVLFYPRLTCKRINDSFTKSSSNGNGSLSNPVGLLTADEVMLAGGKNRSAITNNTNYLNTGNAYWLASPHSFSDDDAYGWYVTELGYLYNNPVYQTAGARPAVSLKPGGTWTGDGTADSPYTVSYS